MRGEDLVEMLRIAVSLRNTPTCVGKTRRRAEQAHRVWKHPHMRGEDLCYLTIHRETIETPPHAWGRLDSGIDELGNRRNTPTCVGKTGI